MKKDLKKMRSREISVTGLYSPGYYEAQGHDKATAKRHNETQAFVIRVEGERATSGIERFGINGVDAETLRNIAKAATKIADLIEAEGVNA